MSANEGHREFTAVVGGGQAAFAFCTKLRELGYAGDIALLSEEEHGPYQRPPLSKAYLLGQTTVERLQFRPQPFYAEHGIDLRLSNRVMCVSRSDRRLTMQDGSTLSYDHLVFATGARARILPQVDPASSADVHYMRTLEDADRFALACRAGRRLLIVGGGYIGLEAAAVARKRGALVTLIEAAPRILQRVAARETADYFRDLHQRHGVDIREGTKLEALSVVDGRIEAATFDDGTTLPVDIVIAGIGVLPNQEVAAEAGVHCDNGIVVDEFCRTSDPRIMAVGDCARIPHDNASIRLESVGHAIEHGHAAAATLMGKTAGYRPKPWFWSDQFEVKLQIAGLSTGYDRVIVRGRAGGPVSHWYFVGDRLLAVDAMNDPRTYMVAKRLIDAGRSISPEVAGDPSIDLKASLL